MYSLNAMALNLKRILYVKTNEGERDIELSIRIRLFHSFLPPSLSPPPPARLYFLVRSSFTRHTCCMSEQVTNMVSIKIDALVIRYENWDRHMTFSCFNSLSTIVSVIDLVRIRQNNASMSLRVSPSFLSVIPESIARCLSFSIFCSN